MPASASIQSRRSLFERFRPAPAGPGIPGIISSIQAYGGLQAWAARTHRPSQSLGRLGSLEVRLAQTAAEVRQAQKLRYRVFYQEGTAIPNPARLFASLDGTDPKRLALPLSFLHHYALAPEQWRARALPGRYVEMNRMSKEAIDPKEALRALPPLIKGYLRLGAYIGDGAVVDHEFGTTDVLIVLPVSAIKKRYFEHFDLSRWAA